MSSAELKGIRHFATQLGLTVNKHEGSYELRDEMGKVVGAIPPHTSDAVETLRIWVTMERRLIRDAMRRRFAYTQQHSEADTVH
jgi:hypothetical protein